MNDTVLIICWFVLKSHYYCFPSLGTWTLEELSSVLGVPQETVRRKLALWQQQGVLREEAGGRYTVQETSSCRERSDRSVMLIDSDEEGDSNTATQSEQREEKLQVIYTHTTLVITQCYTAQDLYLLCNAKTILNCFPLFLSCSGLTFRPC